MYCIVGWRKTVAFRCFAGLSCGFRFEYQVVYRGNLLDAQNMPIEVIIFLLGLAQLAEVRHSGRVKCKRVTQDQAKAAKNSS